MKRILSVLCVAATACGGQGEEAVPGFIVEDIGETAASVSAGAAEVTIPRTGQIALTGGAASGFWDILEEAGTFRSVRYSGIDYLIGRVLYCGRSSGGAFCRINSPSVRSSADYEALVEGSGHGTAAFEVFIALIRAEGGFQSTLERGNLRCDFNAQRYRATCGWTGGRTLEVTLTDAPDLGPDYVYEGWLITPTGPVSSGRWPVGGNGVLTTTLPRTVADAATLFVLTIEPAVGDDPAPAATHLMAGEFDTRGFAWMDAAHPAALGTDFGASSGRFILETPTSPDPSDYRLGIWYVVPGSGPGLDLPEAPTGWVYEGWIVDNGQPISTGRFARGDAPDSDFAGPAAGPNAPPPLPGQDFVQPPLDLVGTTAVISLEPEPDNGPAPFSIKPLIGSISDAGAGQPQSLDLLGLDGAPTGDAVWLN